MQIINILVGGQYYRLYAGTDKLIKAAPLANLGLPTTYAEWNLDQPIIDGAVFRATNAAFNLVLWYSAGDIGDERLWVGEPTAQAPTFRLASTGPQGTYRIFGSDGRHISVNPAAVGNYIDVFMTSDFVFTDWLISTSEAG